MMIIQKMIIHRDPVSNTQTQEFTKVIDALQNDVLTKNGFNFANVIPNGRPDVNSLKFDDAYICPVGQVPVNDECGKECWLHCNQNTISPVII